MGTQKEMFKGGVGVLELPPSVDLIEVLSSDVGYVIEFKTKAGTFTLHMASNAKQVAHFKSLDSVKKRLAKLGWTSGFHVVS